MLLAWCFGATYARFYGRLRHGQRPLRPQTGDEGDVGYLYRRPYLALLWYATLRGRFRYRPRIPATGFLLCNQCLAGRGAEGFPLLYAPYQFGHAAHRLAAPYIYAAATFSYQLSSDYEDESAKASGMADWKGDYNYKTARDSRWGYGLAGGGGIAFLIRRFEINVRARYYFGLSDVVRNRNSMRTTASTVPKTRFGRRLCARRWTTSLFRWG